MKIALYHGYELIGSGSNEYNRYLAKTFLQLGHEVMIICREQQAEQFDFIDKVVTWKNATRHELKTLNKTKQCSLHSIPSGPIYPVYLTDKQRAGNVKSFTDLTDLELLTFISINEEILDAIFKLDRPDLVYASHLVMQPKMAIKACKQYNIPLIFFLHGSAIEYTVKQDQRYLEHAKQAIEQCHTIVSGNTEVRNRIINLFPNLDDLIKQKTKIVGIGVDTELFFPIAKENRQKNLEAFIEKYCINENKINKNKINENKINKAKIAKLTGKTPELRRKLKEISKTNNLKAIQAQFELYTENQFDTDIKTQLLELKLDQPILLFVGALTVGKGIQSLLTALPLVLETYPQTQLLIIGSGAYREILEAYLYSISSKNTTLMLSLAEKGYDLDRNNEKGPWEDVIDFLSSADNIKRLQDQGELLEKQTFFLGRLNHEHLAYLFPIADIAVFPSARHEAYGLVLTEALANGVFPLVSYFSGFKYGIDELDQFLDPGIVNLLKIDMTVDQRVASIATQLIKLIQLGRTQDYTTTLAEIAKKHYDWKHKAKELEIIFQQALVTLKNI